MLNIKPYGASSKLARAIVASDKRLTLVDGFAFAVPATDHFYGTLRNGGRREIVRVDLVRGNELTIARAIDGTTSADWPEGTCFEVEWNPSQLREFLALGGAGGGGSGISPGTYCLGCSTCITVTSDGRITAINNPEAC